MSLTDTLARISLLDVFRYDNICVEPAIGNTFLAGKLSKWKSWLSIIGNSSSFESNLPTILLVAHLIATLLTIPTTIPTIQTIPHVISLPHCHFAHLVASNRSQACQ